MREIYALLRDIYNLISFGVKFSFVWNMSTSWPMEHKISWKRVWNLYNIKKKLHTFNTYTNISSVHNFHLICPTISSAKWGIV
jgi:hypothetical protein